MTPNTVIQITKPQRDFIFSPYTHPSFFGGLGSGKSEAAIQRLLMLMQEDKGVSVAHYFPSYRLAKRRGLEGVQSCLKKLGYSYILNKSDLTITIPALNNGIYYLDTYHDPDSIVSYEIAHGVIDELDTLKKDDAEYAWRKVTERVRQKTIHSCGNTLGVVSTTDHGKKGFCFEKWGYGENIDKGYHYITAGTASNPFLPEGYVEQISKNYDPIMLEAMVYGGWVNFTTNTVYHYYDKQRHKTNKTVNDFSVLHIGLDFNVGGCCAVVFGIDDNKIPYAVSEFTSYDTQDFIYNVQSRYKNKTVIVYPDASGRKSTTNSSISDIAMIEQAGFRLEYRKSNPAIRDRINACNGLLSHDKIFINDTECPRLSNALELQGYDGKGQPEKFTEHPAIDDWADAFGYIVAYKYPTIRAKTNFLLPPKADEKPRFENDFSFDALFKNHMRNKND